MTGGHRCPRDLDDPGACGSSRNTAFPLLHDCCTYSMRTISQREMRNDSGQILRDVESGEVVVVTRRRLPVAQVMLYGGCRKAIRPASAPVMFSVNDLVTSSAATGAILDDLRDER